MYGWMESCKQGPWEQQTYAGCNIFISILDKRVTKCKRRKKGEWQITFSLNDKAGIATRSACLAANIKMEDNRLLIRQIWLFDCDDSKSPSLRPWILYVHCCQAEHAFYSCHHLTFQITIWTCGEAVWNKKMWKYRRTLSVCESPWQWAELCQFCYFLKRNFTFFKKKKSSFKSSECKMVWKDSSFVSLHFWIKVLSVAIRIEHFELSDTQCLVISMWREIPISYRRPQLSC